MKSRDCGVSQDLPAFGRIPDTGPDRRWTEISTLYGMSWLTKDEGNHFLTTSEKFAIHHRIRIVLPAQNCILK